jgi:hypothetical protein
MQWKDLDYFLDLSLSLSLIPLSSLLYSGLKINEMWGKIC